jgi:hypothetical protein
MFELLTRNFLTISATINFYRRTAIEQFTFIQLVKKIMLLWKPDVYHRVQKIVWTLQWTITSAQPFSWTPFYIVSESEIWRLKRPFSLKASRWHVLLSYCWCNAAILPIVLKGNYWVEFQKLKSNVLFREAPWNDKWGRAKRPTWHTNRHYYGKCIAAFTF